MSNVDVVDLTVELQELEKELGELQELIDSAELAWGECEDDEEAEALHEDVVAAMDDMAGWRSEYEDRMEELRSVLDEVGPDADYLIPEDDFQGHAEELASEVENIPYHWPFNCIDWERAADELKHDYNTVEFDGEIYYYRT
jgi:predicted  nucleic acid-binding Zn-ribbon protein